MLRRARTKEGKDESEVSVLVPKTLDASKRQASFELPELPGGTVSLRRKHPSPRRVPA